MLFDIQVTDKLWQSIKATRTKVIKSTPPIQHWEPLKRAGSFNPVKSSGLAYEEENMKGYCQY